MKRISKLLLGILIISSAIFISCEDKDPVIPNPEELITTFIYILTPESGGSNIVLSFEDLDGDGGNPPSYLTEPIPANTTFNGVIQLLNKTVSPIEELTPEILAEQEDHQLFFKVEGANLNISYNDTDADGNPLGLSTKASSGDAGTGTLTITLRHEPDKSATGVSEGNLENAGGETDIEVTFPITIQ